MRMRLIFAVVLLVSCFTISQSQEGETDIPVFEVGFLLGEPLGLSAKWWYSPRFATDIAAAWSFTEDGVFEVFADYLFHPLLLGPRATVPVYIGLGPALRIGDDWFVGARLPIGVQYLFERLPLSIFGEVAPQWQILPDNDFVLGGGAGIRLAFGSRW